MKVLRRRFRDGFWNALTALAEPRRASGRLVSKTTVCAILATEKGVRVEGANRFDRASLRLARHGRDGPLDEVAQGRIAYPNRCEGLPDESLASTVSVRERCERIKDLSRRGRFFGRTVASRDVPMAKCAQVTQIDRSAVLALVERDERGEVSQGHGPQLATLLRHLVHFTDKLTSIRRSMDERWSGFARRVSNSTGVRDGDSGCSLTRREFEGPLRGLGL
jgi:hypothetical protein